MSFVHLQSDQLYTWSDENRNRAFGQPEKTPSGAVAAIAATQGGPPRLADRTLQALRQARVQMRRRSWPWPQILSFGEPLGLAATNGLCAAGISRSGCRIHCQLSASPRNLGSDLRDQSRTPAPPGGALKSRYGRTLRPSSSNRCWIGWRASRQYGRSLAGWQPGRRDQRGGSR